MMLTSMSERMQIGEDKMQQAMHRAEQEKLKLDEIMERETQVPA